MSYQQQAKVRANGKCFYDENVCELVLRHIVHCAGCVDWQIHCFEFEKKRIEFVLTGRRALNFQPKQNQRQPRIWHKYFPTLFISSGEKNCIFIVNINKRFFALSSFFWFVYFLPSVVARCTMYKYMHFVWKDWLRTQVNGKMIILYLNVSYSSTFSPSLHWVMC